MSNGKVVVVGSANLDSSFSVARIPAAGETVTGADLSEAQGGVGANQALAAVRAGAEVELIAAVGNDEGGTGLLADLRREGVGVDSCLRIAGAPTGRAAIWVDRGGENRIVVAAGANAELSSAAVSAALAAMAPPAIVLCQLETPPAAAAAALAWSRANDAIGILNASPALPPADLPSDAAVVIVNEGEAREIAAAAGGGPPRPSALDPGASAAGGHAATIASALGSETVIVTLGAAGALAHRKDESTRVDSPPVDPVDTTGAGDAFAGALAARLAMEDSLEAALLFACAAGALATTRVGAGAAAPTAAAVQSLLHDN